VLVCIQYNIRVLRFHPPIKLTAKISSEILLKVALDAITLPYPTLPYSTQHIHT